MLLTEFLRINNLRVEFKVRFSINHDGSCGTGQANDNDPLYCVFVNKTYYQSIDKIDGIFQIGLCGSGLTFRAALEDMCREVLQCTEINNVGLLGSKTDLIPTSFELDGIEFPMGQ